jgi:hypothetical protein
VLDPDGQPTSCGDNTSDTTINCYAGKGISDEHSSIFPPHSFQRRDGSYNSDYIFFVASGVNALPQPSPDAGVLVLAAPGPIPDQGTPVSRGR